MHTVAAKVPVIVGFIPVFSLQVEPKVGVTVKKHNVGIMPHQTHKYRGFRAAPDAVGV